MTAVLLWIALILLGQGVTDFEGTYPPVGNERPKPRPVCAPPRLLQETYLDGLQGRWSSAVRKLEGEIGKAHKTGNKQCEAVLTAEVGLLLVDQHYYHHFDPEPARRALTQAKELAESAGETTSLANALHGLGRIHYWERLWSAGDWETPRHEIEQAFQLREREGDGRALAESYFYLGLIHEMQGQYEPALESYLNSLRIAREFNDKLMESFSHRHLGYVQEAQGNLAEAYDHYMQSLKLREEIHATVLVPHALNLVAEFLEKHRSESRQSLQLRERSARLARKTGSRLALFDAEAGLARLYLQKKDLDKALCYAHSARRAAELYAAPELLTEASKLEQAIGTKGGRH